MGSPTHPPCYQNILPVHCISMPCIPLLNTSPLTQPWFLTQNANQPLLTTVFLIDVRDHLMHTCLLLCRPGTTVHTAVRSYDAHLSITLQTRHYCAHCREIIWCTPVYYSADQALLCTLQWDHMMHTCLLLCRPDTTVHTTERSYDAHLPITLQTRHYCAHCSDDVIIMT